MWVISITNYSRSRHLMSAIQYFLLFVTRVRLYFNSLNCKTFTMSSQSIMWKYFDKSEGSITKFTYFKKSIFLI